MYERERERERERENTLGERGRMRKKIALGEEILEVKARGECKKKKRGREREWEREREQAIEDDCSVFVPADRTQTSFS